MDELFVSSLMLIIYVPDWMQARPVLDFKLPAMPVRPRQPEGSYG